MISFFLWYQIRLLYLSLPQNFIQLIKSQNSRTYAKKIVIVSELLPVEPAYD
jgi:hypothetical protein